MNNENMTCTICAYGDGKWEERAGIRKPDDLPICDHCAADGWAKARYDDIIKDPELRDSVGLKSPFVETVVLDDEPDEESKS